jgi:DNA-binding beta-propeller fold protein YncE
VAANGDIFVADSHSFDEGNNRVVKYSKEGKFLKAWGKTGYAPGEFRMLHSISLDGQGRVFVADRGNNRIQIFDQDGIFLAQWTQFGRPSGITFDGHDRIYVTDSESDNLQNPGWEMGIRIGDARTGWVTAFIPYPWGDPREVEGTGAEFVAVDLDGNLYGGEPRPRQLRKYVKVHP